ncbi:MAG: hypothetical protein EOO68_15875 [Moraxellaceae bacterium]|nr:MAG: hypothetical protein EOO68_15875 [Moraxellaceae bacterium]
MQQLQTDEVNKGGRPLIVLDDKQIAQVEALAAYLSTEQIADYFKIARNTFAAICERQPEVFEQYKKGRAKAIGNIAKSLISQAQAGNTTAAIFYLKTQAGWKETQGVEHSGQIGINTLSSLMDELSEGDD